MVGLSSLGRSVASVTISYLSGAVDANDSVPTDPYYPLVGPRGYTANVAPYTSGGGAFIYPALYVNPVDDPVYVMALIGAFTNNAGQIVGEPFTVGYSYATVVPAGATQLSFGFNDFYLADDAGSETLAISSVAFVPEPSSWAMLLLGFAGIGFVTYRRKGGLALSKV